MPIEPFHGSPDATWRVVSLAARIARVSLMEGCHPEDVSDALLGLAQVRAFVRTGWTLDGRGRIGDAEIEGLYHRDADLVALGVLGVLDLVQLGDEVRSLEDLDALYRRSAIAAGRPVRPLRGADPWASLGQGTGSQLPDGVTDLAERRRTKS